MIDSKILFARVADQITECVLAIDAKDLGNQTPCDDWNLKQLLNHTVYELLWMPDLLAGKTVAEVGDKYDGDVLGDVFHTAWEDAVAAAKDAAEKADIKSSVHLSGGDKPVDEYLEEMAMEVLIHGWDICQSLGYTLLFEPDVAQAVYDITLPHKEELMANGSVKETIEVPADSPVEVKLLGIMGRSVEGWQA